MRVLTTSIVTTFRHAHGFFAIILITSCATWRIEIEGGGRPYQGINLGVEKERRSLLAETAPSSLRRVPERNSIWLVTPLRFS
jgi:hypothetical protein